MTPKEFVEIARTITYKPGWTLTFTESRHEWVGVRQPYGHLDEVTALMRRMVPDVGHPDQLIQIQSAHRWHIDWHVPITARDYVTLLVGDWLMGLERHEYEEWFHINGTQVYPPHEK